MASAKPDFSKIARACPTGKSEVKTSNETLGRTTAKTVGRKWSKHAATGSFFGLSSIFPISSHTDRRICHLSSNKGDAATVLCYSDFRSSRPVPSVPSVLERTGSKQGWDARCFCSLSSSALLAASLSSPYTQWTTHDVLRFGFGGSSELLRFSHRCRAWAQVNGNIWLRTVGGLSVADERSNDLCQDLAKFGTASPRSSPSATSFYDATKRSGCGRRAELGQVGRQGPFARWRPGVLTMRVV